jgi:hypothetical protein
MKPSRNPTVARLGLLGLLGLLALALALAPVMLDGCGASSAAGALPPTHTPGPTHYTVTLRPLNGTSVTGTEQLVLTGNVLAISLHVTGLEPGREHYQHIHGYPGSTAICPTAANADASGLITVDTGLAVVGPVVLDLQPYPQVTGHGPLDWSQTYALTATQLADLLPLTAHVVVLHGMTHERTYDRALFVACGPIQAA